MPCGGCPGIGWGMWWGWLAGYPLLTAGCAGGSGSAVGAKSMKCRMMPRITGPSGTVAFHCLRASQPTTTWLTSNHGCRRRCPGSSSCAGAWAAWRGGVVRSFRSKSRAPAAQAVLGESVGAECCKGGRKRGRWAACRWPAAGSLATPHICTVQTWSVARSLRPNAYTFGPRSARYMLSRFTEAMC